MISEENLVIGEWYFGSHWKRHSVKSKKSTQHWAWAQWDGEKFHVQGYKKPVYPYTPELWDMFEPLPKVLWPQEKP